MLNYVVDSSYEIVVNLKKKWFYLFENIIYLFIYLFRIYLFCNKYLDNLFFV